MGTTSVTSITTSDSLIIDYKSAVSEWRNRIHDIGAAPAYAELIRIGNQLPEHKGHLLAHAFGEAMVDENVQNGLTICDSRFMWGCYHQLVGNAIAVSGITAADSLLQMCQSVSGRLPKGCVHGVGHGIVSFLGYSEKNLLQSLPLCSSKARGEELVNGCWEGAFMEYNIREFTSASSTPQGRPFTVETRFSPCLHIESKYRSTCIFELPTWWFNAMHGWSGTTDLETNFSRFGTYCNELKSTSSDAKQCFEGIGYIATIQGDIPSALALCAKSSSHGLDNLYCISEASRRYGFEDPAQGLLMCSQSGLSPMALTYCNTFVTSERKSTDNIPIPTDILP